MASNEFPLHSTVRLRGLISKKMWNNHMAQIVGSFSTKRQRYPIVMLASRDKAWIKPENFHPHYATAMVPRVPVARTAAETKKHSQQKSQQESDEKTPTKMETVLNDSNMIQIILSFLFYETSQYDGHQINPRDLSLSDIPTFSEEIGALTICAKWRLVLESMCHHVTSLTAECLEKFTQQHLNSIANTFPRLQKLSLSTELDWCSVQESNDIIDFTKISLPELTELDMQSLPLYTIHFDHQNTPKLKSLRIEEVGAVWYMFLDLKALETLYIEDAELNEASDFGNSLSRCVRLKKFDSRKLRGFEECTQVIVHKELKDLQLYRSDDLQRLQVWAPKLHRFNVRSGYILGHVRLLKGAPAEFMEKNKLFVDYSHIGKEDDVDVKDQAKVDLNIINANIDGKSRRHLENHPRVHFIRRVHEEDDTLIYG